MVLFLNFGFAPSIRNLLRSLTLIAYISKITLDFIKWFKFSDSSNNTLQNKMTCKNQGEPPYAINKHKHIYFLTFKKLVILKKI